jgi:hypothetical protein
MWLPFTLMGHQHMQIAGQQIHGFSGPALRHTVQMPCAPPERSCCWGPLGKVVWRATPFRLQSSASIHFCVNSLRLARASPNESRYSPKCVFLTAREHFRKFPIAVPGNGQAAALQSEVYLHEISRTLHRDYRWEKGAASTKSNEGSADIPPLRPWRYLPRWSSSAPSNPETALRHDHRRRLQYLLRLFGERFREVAGRNGAERHDCRSAGPASLLL